MKIRAEAMHQCSQRLCSGMLTLRVSAATRLDEALEDARTYAWFVLFKNRNICKVIVLFNFQRTLNFEFSGKKVSCRYAK